VAFVVDMGLPVADRLGGEEAIAAEPDVPNLKAMREQIA
jgi:hypothetical protein